jgi:hypothetical protein
MNVYVWDHLNRMSDNYHDNGGVVVVAASLERAHELLRVKGQYGAAVPEDSDVFTTAPTATYPSEGDERVYTFPNAGCC